MESRREQRITWLLQALRQRDKLRLREAAAQLGVSEMTLRRDLSADDTPVVLLGGHLVLARSAAGAHYLLSDQKNRHVKEKRHAARLAAALIKPHQTLFFDCGTTTPFIIEALAPELPFTGICYSLNIFLALREKPQCRVILCGGEFQPGSTVFARLTFAKHWLISAPISPFCRRRASTHARGQPVLILTNCRSNTGRWQCRRNGRWSWTAANMA
jgi:DeoR family deoxyribose operon repressor